jgi:hypothetical protein
VRREVGIWPHASVSPRRRPRAASRRPRGAPRMGTALADLARGMSRDAGLARRLCALRRRYRSRQHRPVSRELERRPARSLAALPLPRLRRYAEASPRAAPARVRAPGRQPGAVPRERRGLGAPPRLRAGAGGAALLPRVAARPAGGRRAARPHRLARALRRALGPLPRPRARRLARPSRARRGAGRSASRARVRCRATSRTDRASSGRDRARRARPPSAAAPQSP